MYHLSAPHTSRKRWELFVVSPSDDAYYRWLFVIAIAVLYNWFLVIARYYNSHSRLPPALQMDNKCSDLYNPPL